MSAKLTLEYELERFYDLYIVPVLYKLLPRQLKSYTIARVCNEICAENPSQEVPAVNVVQMLDRINLEGRK